MKEKLTPYLRTLQHDAAIGRQYLAGNEADGQANTLYNDPLGEDSHEVVKGLAHKYPNRALVKVSYQCAAHCRFCTRIRQIGDPSGTLTSENMVQIADYLQAHEEIDDVILSGGDPFYTPKLTMELLGMLAAVPSIKVFRIGSRMALQSPASFHTPLVGDLMSVIAGIAATRPFYILLQINHPAELTPEALGAIALLRKLPVTLLAQTVFLKGINDSYEVLHSLFRQLYYCGIQPYYLYRCDAVNGLEHFVVDRDTELQIATKLKATLSGIACPTYVVDVANGYGKIPVPLPFMNADGASAIDFVGNCCTIK